jgi:hypothetical protein
MNRNVLVLALLVLLTASLCVAQQDATSAQQPATPSAQQSSSQPTQTDVGQPTDTDQQVFKGCLGGTKDNYTLTTDDGKQYRLHSDKDINEHVGNQVELRGTMKKEGADSQATSTANLPGIDVADIKDVSKGCSAGAK